MIAKQLLIFGGYGMEMSIVRGKQKDKFWKSTKSKERKDIECFSYIASFRSKFESVLQDGLALKITIVSFEGGCVIESVIVETDKAQTIKLEKTYSVYDAYRLANLEMTDAKGRNFAPVRGTKVIVNDNKFHIVKDEHSDCWKHERVLQDFNLIFDNITPISDTKNPLRPV